MRRTIDFEHLGLRDALDIAIIIEEDAVERYRDLAAQLEIHRTHEAADFFTKMIGNEEKHAHKLVERRTALFADEARAVDDSVVPEIEAPAFDSVRAFMTVHQALRIALAAETRAHDFYRNALPKVSDAKVKELFAELLEEEVHHQSMVQQLLDRAGPEDTDDPDDYVDPPVSQG
jgi:rubrerythrin